MTTLTFYRKVIEEAGQANREAAKRATAAVLHALRDRLTTEEADQVAALKEQLSPGEAEDVLAQLPKDLKEVWEEA